MRPLVPQLGHFLQSPCTRTSHAVCLPVYYPHRAYYCFGRARGAPLALFSLFRTCVREPLISTKELSTRYWAPFLTPHDHIPLHSTHVYITIFFAHQPQKRSESRAEAARALERPSHRTRPTVPCLARRVGKERATSRAWAATQSHTRPPARRTSAELTRRSSHTAEAKDRCSASSMVSQAAPTTIEVIAPTTANVPKRCPRCCQPPISCSHHMQPHQPNPVVEHG